MNQNIIQEKSYSFALKIVELYRDLVKVGVERIFLRQLLCSRTSTCPVK